VKALSPKLVRVELTRSVYASQSKNWVAPKSKPLPNDQKSYLNVLKPVNVNRFISHRLLQYESRTIIILFEIRYSMRDLLSDLNNYA